MGDSREIECVEQSGALVVRLTGRLDISRSEEFEKTVSAHLKEKPRDMVINFSNVTYMSSSGIRALLALYRLTGSIDKRMHIADVPPVVKKVIDVVEIGQVFRVFEREADAVAALIQS